MKEQNPQQIHEVVNEEENSFFNIDYKKLLADVIQLWWLFVLSVIIAFVSLSVYHRYKKPIYNSQLTMIVDDQGQNGSRMMSQNSLVDGFMVDPGMRSIENQVAVLQSRTLVQKAVESMNIYMSFYSKGHVITSEQYKFNKFNVVIDSTHAQPLNVPIYISDIDEQTYRLSLKAENVSLYDYSQRSVIGSIEQIDCNVRCRYGDPIITPWGAFSIIRNQEFGDGIYFCFNDPEVVANSYYNSLGVDRNVKTNSSVVSLSISGPVVEKNNDFLNTMANTFLNENLEQKNQIADNTIKFIEDQLNSLADTLNIIGTQLSSYKVSHGFEQTVSSKSEEIFKERQRKMLEVYNQRNIDAYYDYLAEYFSNDTILGGVIAPAVFATESPVITEQLRQIMSLNSEKQTYEKAENPVSRDVMAKLQIARNTLLLSIDNHKDRVRETIEQLEVEIKDLDSRIAALPETERMLLGIDRKYSLNNDVYTYLMRKRSESQIQKASNTPDHRIIDPATNMGRVSPNIKRNQLLGLVVAILIPLCFLVLRQLLDSKIRTQDDIKKISDLPVVGEVTSNRKDTSLVVLEHPKSILSEVFRRMRTRINFMIGEKDIPVIGVTSSMPGEGKTFCAINIASVFAISGKKTVLLGFDLRKPGLSKVFSANNSQGLSNYLIGACSIDEMVYQISDGFDLLPSGDIPPNPAELIASPKCQELLEELKKRYDVIVIDTPPMGLVSDAYTIARWCDTLMFIVRQDYTLKEAFQYTVDTLKNDGIKNVGLVINDVNNNKSRYGYGYGYGHYGKYGRYGKYGHYGKSGYGYGYGYGENGSHGYYAEE